MAAKVVTTEEFRKMFGRRPTTISTISPEEFGRRMSAYWQKVKTEEAKKKAETEAKAQATCTTEK